MKDIIGIPIVYGTFMALIDVFMLGLLKAIHLGWVHKALIFLPTVVYSMQPWVFLASLKYESLTVMNLLWDVMSDVLVTMTGLYFFGEELSYIKKLGVIFAFMAVIALSWEKE